jgi:hypothetical protein
MVFALRLMAGRRGLMRHPAVISLESFVPKDHFLRQVDRALDLSFVRELTAPCYADRLGRPSIDPEVYFRMQLVAYLYGIQSERRLCEDIYCNLAYRWFCRLSPQDDVQTILGYDCRGQEEARIASGGQSSAPGEQERRAD